MSKHSVEFPVRRLREAASKMRGDESTTFWFALADWLDREATMHDTMTDLSNVAEALMQKDDPKATVMIDWGSDSSQLSGSTIPQALAVAESYLASRSVPSGGTV